MTKAPSVSLWFTNTWHFGGVVVPILHTLARILQDVFLWYIVHSTRERRDSETNEDSVRDK